MKNEQINSQNKKFEKHIYWIEEMSGGKESTSCPPLNVLLM